MKIIACTQVLCAASLMPTSPAQVIERANKEATYQPESQQFFNAAMVFDWQANKIYQVYTQPGRITDIALELGEKLLSIAGGDTQRWVISESQSGDGEAVTKHVFVKPHQLGLSNNLVFTTDRRVYHVELHALENVPYQAVVSWNYPHSLVLFSRASSKASDPSTPLSGLERQQLNFNYHFVAETLPKWLPRRVFDDGHKTYIEFPLTMQSEEAPALWLLSKSRDREVINYRRYQNFYIVDHRLDLAELSIGETVVGIEREDMR